jgi:putative aldouronate transport system substrate-binding protein
MKKITLVTLIFLCLVAAATFIWVEGQGEGQGEGPGTTGPTYEILWYFIGNGPQKDVALIEEEASKYIQSKGLNATVRLVCFDWGSYTQKLQTITAAGEKFDICFTAVWANFYRPQATKGAFVPLNDLLNKFAPKTKAALGDDFLAGSAIDGVNYAIPANKEKAHNWGVILRKDLVEKHGLDVSGVKTLADLAPLFEVIKAK